MGKDGEQIIVILGTPSADLICTNGKGLYLVIDCTLNFPNDEKINKIFTTAKSILQRRGVSFLPIIVTSKQMIKGKKDNKVVILDLDDVKIIHEEIFRNKNLQRAGNFFHKCLDIEKYENYLFE